MGDINQLIWVKKNLDFVKSDVIEIGSKFYSKETFMDYRNLCTENGLKYIGTDLIEGQNVDMVVDFTENISIIEKKLGNKFNTVICCSVLEHVKDIVSFANNVSAIVNQGGVLLLYVPFTWEFHGYPNDYWRFTPAAVEYLFNHFSFPTEYRTISSHISDDMEQIVDNPNHFSYSVLLNGTNNPHQFNKPLKFLNFVYNLIIKKKLIDSHILFNSIGTTRILKPSCINMVGIKK